MTDFTDILAPLINHHGQRAVARDTGISHTAITLWLSGERNMPLARQITIAEALGCKVTLKITPPRLK